MRDKRTEQRAVRVELARIQLRPNQKARRSFWRGDMLEGTLTNDRRLCRATFRKRGANMIHVVFSEFDALKPTWAGRQMIGAWIHEELGLFTESRARRVMRGLQLQGYSWTPIAHEERIPEIPRS